MVVLKNKVYDKAFKLPANKFTRKGYKFAGWNTKKDGSGTTYKDKNRAKNLTTKNKGTATLYAQWKLINYNVKYVLNGGVNNEANPTSYNVTSNLTFKNPTKQNYSFAGWYLDSKFKKRVKNIKSGTTGNKTLYAKWAKKIISANTTNVTMLAGQQYVIKVTETVSTTLEYSIEDSSVVSGSFGSFSKWKNGSSSCDLTLTAKSSGETTVIITNKYNSDSIVINVKVNNPWENTTLDVSGPIVSFLDFNNTMDIKNYTFGTYDSNYYKMNVSAEYRGSNSITDWGGYLYCYDANDNILDIGYLYFGVINTSGLTTGYLLCPMNTKKIKDVYTSKSDQWDINSLKVVEKYFNLASEILEAAKNNSTSAMGTKSEYATNLLTFAMSIIDTKVEAYEPSSKVIEKIRQNMGEDALLEIQSVVSNTTMKESVETTIEKLHPIIVSIHTVDLSLKLDSKSAEGYRQLADMYLSRAKTINSTIQLEFE